LTDEAPSLEDGAIVWVDYDPATGREQRGKRPYIAVSSATSVSRSGPFGSLAARVAAHAEEVPEPLVDVSQAERYKNCGPAAEREAPGGLLEGSDEAFPHDGAPDDPKAALSRRSAAERC
jgi:hypothetical protein